MTRRKAGLWLPVVIYMAAIFALSSLSGGPDLPGILGWDKLKHFVAYAGLAAVTARALKGERLGKGLAAVGLYAVAISSVYGVTDEVHQFFVPERCCDLGDWIADILGSITGVLIVSAVFHLRCR